MFRFSLIQNYTISRANGSASEITPDSVDPGRSERGFQWIQIPGRFSELNQLQEKLNTDY